MITNITIQNLGCFDDFPYSVNFEKFTVLIGPNNSGKSTIFKGHNLVRSIPFLGGGISWDSVFYSLNSYESSVYGHDTNRVISVSSKYEVDSDSFESKFEYKGRSFTRNDFLRNGQKISELSSEEHKKIASTVWYISPNRTEIPYGSKVGQGIDPMQPLHPNGKNVSEYLIGRFTSKDPNWSYAEKWLQRIDKNMTILKTPLNGNIVSLVTTRTDGSKTTDVNINLQGSGIQNASTIIAALIFSPAGSTIILEEPESFLHPRGIDVLINLCNDVISKFGKQIIISTHSMEIIHRISSDLQGRSSNSENCVPTDRNHFKCLTFSHQLSQNKIKEKDLTPELSLGQLYDELIQSETV